MSDAVSNEIKINDEFRDPIKQIHASFLGLFTADVSDLLENPKTISTELYNIHLVTRYKG